MENQKSSTAGESKTPPPFSFVKEYWFLLLPLALAVGLAVAFKEKIVEEMERPVFDA